MNSMKWPETSLTEKLGINYPIIQAPMAGGVTTPELVAAVSNAGGLGSLGAGYMEPEEIRRAIRQIRALTDKPFAVNLFIPEAVTEDAERIIRANELLAPYRRGLGLPEAEPLAAYLPDYTEQLGVLFEESVKILSFHLWYSRTQGTGIDSATRHDHHRHRYAFARGDFIRRKRRRRNRCTRY